MDGFLCSGEMAPVEGRGMVPSWSSRMVWLRCLAGSLCSGKMAPVEGRGMVPSWSFRMAWLRFLAISFCSNEMAPVEGRRMVPSGSSRMVWLRFLAISLLLSSFSLNLEAWPIIITGQPADVIDCEDRIVSFRVTISGGNDPVTFTWQRQRPSETGFSDIPPGAPNISYPAPGTLRVANVGSYENPSGTLFRVVISDPGGAVTSGVALLTVNEITDIIPSVAFPLKTNVILCEGDNFSYTVITSGTPPIAYQWKKYAGPGLWVNVTDNAVISGANSAVLTFTGATPDESGEYRVNLTFHASGADCHVQSDSRVRRLTIQGNLTPPVIEEERTLCQGIPPEPLVALPAGGGSGTFGYQWQQSQDNVSWSDIPEASSLTWMPSLPLTPAWFRVEAVDMGVVSCGSVTGEGAWFPVIDCFNLHYRSRKDGSWNNPDVWETSSDRVNWGGTAYTWPTSEMLSTTIAADHGVLVDRDICVDHVTVDPGGSVTVAPGNVLQNVGGAPGFVLLSDDNGSGSLIAEGEFPGQLTYKRFYEPARWYIISSPLLVSSGFDVNNSVISFSTEYGEYNFAWYREAGNKGWSYFPTLPGALDPGKGYLAALAETSLPEEGIITFSGGMNGMAADTVSPMVYLSGPRWGWNAIGNPFTSAIGVTGAAASAENFLERNSDILEDSYGAVYVWNQTGGYDGNQQYYRAIGNSGYNFPGFSFYGGDDPDYAQTGQGFLINVKGDARAVFSKQMQVHQPRAGLKSAGNSWPGLVLTAENEGSCRRAMVAFNDRMSLGLDKTFDAGLLPADGFYIFTRLASGETGADLEVQCLPDGRYDELVIPVGIALSSGGEVKLSAAGVLLPKGIYPILEDRLLNVFWPLDSENEFYRVTLPARSYVTGRFFLRFGNSSLTVGGSQERTRLSAWWSNGKIIVSGLSGGAGATLVLYSTDGRRLAVYKSSCPDRLEIDAPWLPAGVYLLLIRQGSDSEVVKIGVPWR